MRTELVAFVAVGYLVALVPTLGTRADIHRFRRSLWVGFGRRDTWLHALELTYLVFGWPALAVCLLWWRGRTRKALVAVRDDLRETREEPERLIARA